MLSGGLPLPDESTNIFKNKEYRKLMNNYNMVLLVMIGGIAAGVNSGWGGLLS